MVLPAFLLTTLLNEYTLYHPEQPGSTFPDNQRIGAAAVLWNPSTSGYKVYVKNMKVMNQMSQDIVIGSSQLNIQRISAYVTNDYTANAGYIVKMNSTNPALPSQVKILTRVDSVTTSGAVLRSFMNLPEFGDTIVQARTIAISPAKKLGTAGFDTCNVYNSGYCSAATTGQVLREGEGLAFVAANIQVNVAYRFSILFKTGDGSTYGATETIRPYATMSPMLIFNGVGSGVIITVLNIECQEVGTDSLCQFAIQKIDDIFLGSDEVDVTANVLKMDSTNVLPPGLKCYTNCLVELAGVKNGAVTVAPTFRRNAQMWLGTGPSWAVGPRMYGTVTSSELIDNGANPIIVRPGEGIAIMQKNASSMGRYEATIFFQTEPISQAHAYASVT
jgi:hypothetical protein